MEVKGQDKTFSKVIIKKIPTSPRWGKAQEQTLASVMGSQNKQIRSINMRTRQNAGTPAHPKMDGKGRKKMPIFHRLYQDIPLFYVSPSWKQQCYSLDMTFCLWLHPVLEMLKSDHLCTLQLGNSRGETPPNCVKDRKSVGLRTGTACRNILHSCQSLLSANKQETEQDEKWSCL